MVTLLALYSRLPAAVHSWLGEPLRSGTRGLARELRRRGCSTRVYPSSGRTPVYVRRWLLLYSVRIDGVVNSVLHTQALTAHGQACTSQACGGFLFLNLPVLTIFRLPERLQ